MVAFLFAASQLQLSRPRLTEFLHWFRISLLQLVPRKYSASVRSSLCSFAPATTSSLGGRAVVVSSLKVVTCVQQRLLCSSPDSLGQQFISAHYYSLSSNRLPLLISSIQLFLSFLSSSSVDHHSHRLFICSSRRFVSDWFARHTSRRLAVLPFASIHYSY